MSPPVKGLSFWGQVSRQACESSHFQVNQWLDEGVTLFPEKPYALSCDKNSEPILSALKDFLPGRQALLEVGAGTGQHAIYMAPHFLDMTWTLSDQKDRHEGISLWLKDFPRVNVLGPVEYSIGQTALPPGDFDCIFTANTLHIVSWAVNLKLFDDVSRCLPKGGLFIVYGAFNYKGDFTSASNREFNSWLLERYPEGGIRDFEKVCDELEKRGLVLKEDRSLPANNRLLVFSKDKA